MPNTYDDYPASSSSPATHARAIAPTDGADLTDVPKGIYVGTGGDLVLIGVAAGASATGVTFRNVPSGALLPFRARRVLATGTTAADLLGLY